MKTFFEFIETDVGAWIGLMVGMGLFVIMFATAIGIGRLFGVN